MRHEDKLPENIGLGVMIAIIAGMLLFVCISWMLWQIPIPDRMIQFDINLKCWIALKINELAPPLFQSTADGYRHYLDVVEIGSWPFLLRFNTAAFIAIFIGGYVGYLVGRPQSAIRHIAGRQLWRGNEAIKHLYKLSKKECETGGEGLAMHPDFTWRLSRDRETRHFMIIGSTGGGKTQIILPLVRGAIVRNDRMVIYDFKGDFTSLLSYHILIAPWDSRSHAWDIAKDCRNLQDAIQLAARLIPAGHDPVWHQAARQLLTAILLKLQAEKGDTWDWLDLYNLVCSSQQILLSIVQKYLPIAIHTVSAPGKTTQSVLINFGAHMSLIADLAKAWGNTPPKKRFSFFEWLRNGNTPYRIVILQGSERYAELAQSYIQSVLAMAAGIINSPGFPNSKKRRIWFFFDEFPTIGELRAIASLLPVARSKGIRVVLTAQDIHQIKEIYGDNVASTWMSMVGTLIVTRLNAGPTANFIAKDVIGYQTIDRVVIHQEERQTPIRENILVVEPSELESDLGRHGDEVSAIVLGYGDAFLLEWPITKYDDNNLLREASIEADWLKPAQANAKQNTSSQADLAPIEQSITAIPKRPKLALRAPTEVELQAMAETGTAAVQAAEPLEDMSDDATGGNHESR